MLLCNFKVGPDHPFFLIAGPCVIESEELSIEVAGQLKELNEMYKAGILTEEEFKKAKEKALSQ